MASTHNELEVIMIGVIPIILCFEIDNIVLIAASHAIGIMPSIAL
jgi:hypothetical protein